MRKINKSNIIVKCACGKEFITKSYKLNAGKGKYCSLKCKYKYTKRRLGLIYIKHKENPTSFKKGLVPWNKDSVGLCKPNITSFQKGEHRSMKTEFSIGETLGENNAKWKGDAVGYDGLHTWVRRRLGKADHCCLCNGIKAKKYYWHNISLKYKRDLSDWQSLCPSCHRKLHIRLRKELDLKSA